MKPLAAIALIPAALVLFAQAAQAEEISRWTMRVGPAYMQFHTKATIAIGGNDIPGSSAKFENRATLGAEVAYACSDALALRVLLGYPPSSKLTGSIPAGALGPGSPAATLAAGEVTFGALVTTLTWSPGSWGGFKPYVGVGIARGLVLKEKDSAAVTNLHVKPAWGSALQLGVDFMLDQHWGLFVDVRKIYLKTSASGNATALGGAILTASGRADPVAAHTGITYRF